MSPRLLEFLLIPYSLAAYIGAKPKKNETKANGDPLVTNRWFKFRLTGTLRDGYQNGAFI